MSNLKLNIPTYPLKLFQVLEIQVEWGRGDNTKDTLRAFLMHKQLKSGRILERHSIRRQFLLAQTLEQ